MRLNILSDLHLSLGALAQPATRADVVILAGDIARPREAIAWASAIAGQVLYVPGNHEFYGGNLAGTIAELRRLSAATGVRVLDSDAVVIDGVRFLGTTLWTDFMLYAETGKRAAAMGAALRCMRDFTRIRIDDASEALLTPADCSALFDRQSRWLAAKLAEPHAGTTVVITHHAPSRRSIHPRFADSLLNACFVSDAEHLLDGNRASLWIHGHTHDSFDYVVNGMRVVCNPRGYAKNGINENPRFDANFIAEVG